MFRESRFLMAFTQGSGGGAPPGSLYKGLRVSDQPSGSSSLLSPARVRRNSAGDEAAPPPRHQEHHLHTTSSSFQSKSHNGNSNGHSLDESQADSHELSYGDLQYSTHSESTVEYSTAEEEDMTMSMSMTLSMIMILMMTMIMIIMLQVQYSERESERGGSGVGLGSRERLAPPSSSSESLGESLGEPNTL